MSDPLRPVTDTAMRQTVRIYLGILLGMAVILGLLHYFFADVRVGKIAWFHLDKERNIPTWFSGLLFFLFGCSAFVAYYWEQRHNRAGQPCFRLPILWLGVGFAGLYMSLDEMTILHENLYWREVRLVSRQFGAAWIYATQWEILFAPAIIVILCTFVLFFSHRFRAASSGAWRSALSGVGCWFVALTFEGLRGTFKVMGKSWYFFEVIIEEEMEMLGTILLLSSIIFYTIDISLELNQSRQDIFKKNFHFLTKKSLSVLSITIILLLISSSIIYSFAQKQAVSGTKLPRLYKKATRNQVAEKSVTSPAYEFWFKDITDPISLAASDAEDLIRFAMTSMVGGKSQPEGIPAAFRTDTSPRIILLSVSDGLTPAHVAVGSSKGFAKAIEQARSRIHRFTAPGYQPKWIKLDIVQQVYPQGNVDLHSPLACDMSLQGIAFDRKSGIVLLPEELMSYRLVTKKRMIQHHNIDEYLKKRFIRGETVHQLRQSGTTLMYCFTTLSLFSDGENVQRLYRGHRLVQQLSRERLLLAARWGGRYLTQAVGSDGRFAYAYHPTSGKVSKTYNILRHAGSVYAMLELYQSTGEAALLQAARRALVYLVRAVQSCQIGTESTDCIVEKGKVKLGGNALAILALSKYVEVTHDLQYMPIMRRLGRWIQGIQSANGEFTTHIQTYPGGKRIDFVSEYYPGEAILALLRLYALEPHDSWLDTAEKGAQYLINNRDHGVSLSALIHDHWLLYALNELYRYRPHPAYLNHASRLSRAIVSRQNRHPRYPDWLGSYYRPPRSTPTATRTEGLCAAYQLVGDFGEAQAAETILAAIRQGILFQLQTQFGPESVLYFEAPQRAVGGFHRSLTNFEIRIDYVQHNISSLLGLYRLLPHGTGS